MSLYKMHSLWNQIISGWGKKSGTYMLYVNIRSITELRHQYARMCQLSPKKPQHNNVLKIDKSPGIDLIHPRVLYETRRQTRWLYVHCFLHIREAWAPTGKGKGGHLTPPWKTETFFCNRVISRNLFEKCQLKKHWYNINFSSPRNALKLVYSNIQL